MTPLASTHALRVIVIDDDALQLRVLQRQFRGNPRIELSVFSNPLEAMLAVTTTDPDLVVVDVFMPGLDGIEACRRIKANPATAGVRVVITSIILTPELERTVLEAGAAGLVGKPLDMTALLESALAEVPRPPAPEPVRGADLMIDMLARAGVDVVFGLPGGAISPIHDALMDSPIRAITTRHESGAMFAATAYARMTGKLAAVAVTSGPGFLNAMTGLATAWCESVPLLLMVGEIPRHSHGRGVMQDGSAHGLQVVETARHITKFAAEVTRPSAIPHLLRRAIDTAMSGRRGPVLLTLPLDVMGAQLTPPRGGGELVPHPVLEPDLIDEVATVMMYAERPLILAGSGLRGGDTPARLRAVAEQIGCPVVTTPKGKGVFPEEHPLALGVLGLGGHASARRYAESGIDAVFAIGTSLGDLATNGFSAALQAPALIHVDIDPRQIGKSYAPTHAVVAPADDFLLALGKRIAERRPRSRTLRPSTGGLVYHKLPSSKRPDRIASQDALAEIQSLVPLNTIYTVDAGEHTVFATHFLRVSDPDSFVVMTGLGSMGPSIGAAIGVQLAHPERFVAAICGDGCFAMNAFEITTAVIEKLPIRVFVFNDERLGMVEIGHENVYGRFPSYPTGPLDICAIAKGLGATALRISQPGHLRTVHDTLLNTQGPVVIDVRIDPDISIPRQDRVLAMMPPVHAPKSVMKIVR